jgi:hypothetical protein
LICSKVSLTASLSAGADCAVALPAANKEAANRTGANLTAFQNSLLTYVSSHTKKNIIDKLQKRSIFYNRNFTLMVIILVDL